MNKLDSLLMIIATLRGGYPVYSSRIKVLLTRSEWSRFYMRMHGYKEPNRPSDVREQLARYLQRLKKADRMRTDAERQKRRGTMIGPSLFRTSEGAYDDALEALSEIVDDHPELAHYLAPYPAQGLFKSGMPRLRRMNGEAPQGRVYSISKGATECECAAELLEGICRRELARAERRHRSHAHAHAPSEQAL